MLIVLHFAGILTVVIGAPPGPWIVAQATHWLFRPYLDFMYLNNAYRFYSPEPGPASQLWMRIEYRLGDRVLTRWTKLPEVDERGRHKYLTSLQYTRRLALTENVSRTDPMPPLNTVNSLGEIELAPFVKRREEHMPKPNFDVLGKRSNEKSLEIPPHPDPTIPGYQQPNLEGQQLLPSYARYILRQAHPDFPDAKPEFVKIYRVQHRIVFAEGLARGLDPRDWMLYLPYYVGKYDVKGRLVDPEDPLLYWLLPILRENEQDPRSRLKCYIFKHAGESEWIVPSPWPR